jgi:hypothetical protein
MVFDAWPLIEGNPQITQIAQIRGLSRVRRVAPQWRMSRREK